jgi:hypothetical protein
MSLQAQTREIFQVRGRPARAGIQMSLALAGNAGTAHRDARVTERVMDHRHQCTDVAPPDGLADTLTCTRRRWQTLTVCYGLPHRSFVAIILNGSS